MEMWTIREVNWLERRKLPEQHAAGESTHPGALEKRRDALAFLNESSHLSRGMIKKTTAFGAHSQKLALIQAPQRLLAGSSLRSTSSHILMTSSNTQQVVRKVCWVNKGINTLRYFNLGILKIISLYLALKSLKAWEAGMYHPLLCHWRL